MNLLYGVLLFIAVQRIIELIYANANTKRALANGGVEVAPAQHNWLIGLHAAWLVALFFFIPSHTEPNLPLLALFLLLQIARIWTIASLGRFWTTRIITFSDAPLVRRGPYRWFRHPNYTIVTLEVAVLPLAFGAWQIALLFTILNGIALFIRIRVEERALEPRRGLRM
ncbi:MAG TPA: isoprenylcysteine carboxylmethyltransferase family protein [Candidatus Dormibacteraeota bacterium]|nr:isoprenylcysteine carboxylmethyltransferase family protein [Candidatus Dormibacteraeota bacterium]